MGDSTEWVAGRDGFVAGGPEVGDNIAVDVVVAGKAFADKHSVFEADQYLGLVSELVPGFL